MPASETSATTAPARDARRELARAGAFVVLVQAHEPRGDPVAREQHARVARVLAGDTSASRQRGEHAQRDVLEVADRRRAHDQPPDRRLAGVIPQI